MHRATCTLFAIGVALAISGCSKPAPSPAAQAPPVTVSRPLEQEVLEWDEYVGRVAPVNEVEVRAQVSGYLDSVHFTDGKVVKKGDLLFVIDQRPYQATLQMAKAQVTQASGQVTQARAQVTQAKAQVAQAQANQTKTKLDVERFRPLAAEKAITAQELDNAIQANLASTAEVQAAQAKVETANAAVVAAEAGVEAAKAGVRTAELNLGFTNVTAPLSGRVSRRLVSAGNLISGGTPAATLLTTIVSLDSVQVYFEADERAYLKYTRLSRSGERPSSREVRNPARMALADEDGFPHEGYVDFVENRLDANTSTIQGRALFQNPGNTLTPGLFVRLQITGSGKYQGLLIADESIGSNQGQKFVYKVDANNEVVMQPVEMGPLVDGLRVVRKGVTATDRIIVGGLQRVRPKAKVTPKEVPLMKAQGASK